MQLYVLILLATVSQCRNGPPASPVFPLTSNQSVKTRLNTDPLSFGVQVQQASSSKQERAPQRQRERHCRTTFSAMPALGIKYEGFQC